MEPTHFLEWALSTTELSASDTYMMCVEFLILDYKGTNYELFKQLRFRAIGSPSYEHVPAFQWSTSNLEKTVKHVGHPDLWNFKAVERKWETLNVKANL
jgi:hypothetical protein